MFRYTIALDLSFSGQTPTMTDDVAADLPMHARLTITLGHPINIVAPDGGQMNLPAGTRITGTIIGKQALPPPPPPPPANQP